jgi:hypothetical protein
MTDVQEPSNTIDGFFFRCGLDPQDRLDCYSFLDQLYPASEILSASCQGYCSMTVFVGNDTVVQFRPYSYRLDLRITDAARRVYGSFAPETRYIATILSSGLLVYAMGRIDGISYKDFRTGGMLMADPMAQRARLCREFAIFMSKSWHNSNVDIPLGRVGKSIISRLKSLSTDLPTRFQPRARHLLQHIHQIEALPWVLTHGDIVAANIMVEPSNGGLTGLVDWAEAERLPFGICFYGLEEILGEMTAQGFQHYQDAGELRDIFWEELILQIPDLRESALFDTVKLAGDLGVLLWHGIAFDNGSLDRVVQEGRDVEEIHRLDAFLDLQIEQSLDRNSKI